MTAQRAVWEDLTADDDVHIDYDAGVEDGIVALGDEPERLPIPTGWVRRWDRVVRRSGAVPLVEQWADDDAGRPAGYNKRGPKRAITMATVLTLIYLAARNREAVTFANLTRIITDRRLNHTGYQVLGLTPPDRDADPAALYKHTYEQVRDIFHQWLTALDSEPDLPWRRLQRYELDEIVAKAAAVTDPETAQKKADRRAIVMDALVHAALREIPDEILSRWEGDAVTDATYITVHGKRGTRSIQEGDDLEERKYDWVAHDAFAGRYHRDGDHSGNKPTNRGILPRHQEVSLWGREVEIVLMTRSLDANSHWYPLLAVGARVHNPGSTPPQHTVSILRGVRAAGYPAGTLVGDRVYGSSPKPENYQTPARELGYRLVHDYKVDQVGLQHTSKAGFKLVDGQWYSPCLPDVLASVELDWRRGNITTEQRNARILERQTYRARPKGDPDGKGTQRFECMAAGPNATATCPLKKFLRTATARGGLTVIPAGQVPARPPKACTQTSATIRASEGAKYRMDMTYRSDEWHVRYTYSRQAIESFNKHLKRGSYAVLGDAQNRPQRGVAAQSVLVAVIVAAGNHIKYISWLRQWGNVAKDDPEPPGRHDHRNETWGRRGDGSRDYETGTDPPDDPG